MDFKKNIADHFKSHYRKYIFCFIIGVAILGLSLLSRKIVNLYYIMDGFFFGGIILFCLGGLSIVTYFGAFDMFSYAFSKKSVKKDGYYQYSISGKERRAKNKHSYIPYFLIGLIFILTAFIIRLFI